MSVILTEGLSKHYGSRVGVAELDLEIDEGTVCGFLGPNGVGKTTTIRLLLGFLRPTRGTARIFGRDCWHDGPMIRKEVGYVPGDLRLDGWLTTRRAIDLFGKIRRRDISRVGLELAEEFGLELDVRVRNMSRGRRQKLGLVLALAHEPRLLILDEPTMSLDPVMQERLKSHLLSLASRGHTIFFSSHTLSEVERLCKRVVILRGGRVVADAAVSDLRERARREVVVRWKDGEGSSVEPPDCLEMIERSGRTWRAAMSGTVEELLRWLAAQSLEDVIIGPPDMESLFQQYYEE
jgi:ABC-2 type transport system ATP-binding protein